MFGAQPKQVAVEEDAEKQPELIQDTEEERGDQWISEMEAARRVGEFPREFANLNEDLFQGGREKSREAAVCRP